MNTSKIKTRFMQGNIDLDGDVFNAIVNNLGMKKAMEIDFDFDNAIYSNGFVSAIKEGLIPDFSTLRTSCSFTNNKGNEYHHVIVEDDCFVVDFKEI